MVCYLKWITYTFNHNGYYYHIFQRLRTGFLISWFLNLILLFYFLL